jgi:hypothetical protein
VPLARTGSTSRLWSSRSNLGDGWSEDRRREKDTWGPGQRRTDKSGESVARVQKWGDGCGGARSGSSKWRVRAGNCCSSHPSAPLAKIARGKPREPSFLRPEVQRAPAEPPGLAGAVSPRDTWPRLTPGLRVSPPRLTSACPEHPRPPLPQPPRKRLPMPCPAAAALRRALQPGEAPASAELGPSSPGASSPRQSRRRRPPPARTRLLPRPPPRPPPRRPGAPRRRSPANSRAAAAWPPAVRPSPRPRGSRSRRGALCAARARAPRA